MPLITNNLFIGTERPVLYRDAAEGDLDREGYITGSRRVINRWSFAPLVFITGRPTAMQTTIFRSLSGDFEGFRS